MNRLKYDNMEDLIEEMVDGPLRSGEPVHPKFPTTELIALLLDNEIIQWDMDEDVMVYNDSAENTETFWAIVEEIDKVTEKFEEGGSE